MKRLFVVGGIVIVLLLGSILALPFLIDPNRFRPMLEKELSSALSREVKVGDLKLAILKGSVSASDLSISDDPAYSKVPFLRAKSLAVGVEMWPLITSRKLHVTGLTIDQPSIVLIQSQSGEWNFSSLGGKDKPHSAQPAAPAGEKQDLDLSVKLIRIKGGELALSTAGEHTRPLVLRNVDIEVKDFAAASEFPFSLKAKVTGGGSVALDGKAGPINPSDTAASPASLALKIDGLDLVGSGLAQHAPTLAGLITIDGSGRTDGKTAHIQGKLKAEKLKLAKEGTPAKKPVAFEFALDHDLRRRSGRLQKGDIHIGAAPARLTGTYATHGETASLNMTLDGPKMPVDELTELLPAMAVVLPRGSSLKGGTASAKISIDGPMDKLVTDGTVSLDNTKLTGFDMGRKMAFVEALAGIKASNDTEIQTLGAALHYSPEGGRVQNLQFIVPSIGNLQGDGTVSPANDLAFDMRATIRSIAVPFKIQGPATDPSFRPDVKGIAKEQIKSVVGSESVKGLLKGILGRK